ncbi:MAG: YchJ family protein [Candidatus Krumholzibacteriia bacterium]
MAMQCACGSQLTFEECCRPVIKGERFAETPEQLMRARYTAYTMVEMEFLEESMHPDTRENSDPQGTRDWAENSKWLGLEILKASGDGPDDEAGEVEFIASFEYGGEFSPYHEVATFSKVDGRWYFVEGRKGVNKPLRREEPKVGRNDPCPCGSGKKFKRCCGN